MRVFKTTYMQKWTKFEIIWLKRVKKYQLYFYHEKVDTTRHVESYVRIKPRTTAVYSCIPNLVDLCIRYMYIAYYYSCILSVRLSAFYAIFKFYVNFSKLRFRKSPYDFFKFVCEILPIQPIIQTWEKISPPPFFSKMRTFFKNRPPWLHFYGNSGCNNGGRFLSCSFKKSVFSP